MERIAMREEEIETIRVNDGMEESEKTQMLRAKRRKSIDDVLEEVGVLITPISSTSSQEQSPRRF